jgi:hypothetical protein
MSSFRGSLIILMIAVRLSAGVGPAERRRGQRPDERRGANRRAGSGQGRAQSRIPTQRPRAIPTAQLKTAPRLRLALNQLGGSQPATPATPEKKQ